jgi:hypothetical protein
VLPYETGTILTPVALKTFNTLDVLESIEKYFGPRSIGQDRFELSTLAGMLVHRIRTCAHKADFRKHLQSDSLPLSLRNSILHNHPFYFHGGSTVDTLRQRRHNVGVNHGPRKILLSSATLLLVPSHLMIQWKGEIYKHLEDDSLRTICIDVGNKIPAAEELAANYDLVIMTHPR